MKKLPSFSSLLIKIFVKNNTDINNQKVRQSYGYLAGFFGVISNLSLFVLKFLIGNIMNSIAVTADAFNNLADAASSLVTILSFKISSKPPDKNHPFGHGRFEYLAGLVVATMIVIVGVQLAEESVTKILNPAPLQTSFLSIILLTISVIVKFYQGLFNKKLGKLINSSVLLATSKDSFNDAISTTAVIFAVFLTGQFDGFIGIIVAIFILKSGYNIIVDTIDPLLGTPASKEFVEEIIAKILEFDGVVGTHDLIIHDYGPGRKLASVHAEIPDSYDFLTAHEISDNIERKLSADLGIFLTVHIDPITVDTTETAKIRTIITKTLADFNKELSFHDLRIVKGDVVTNVITDIVVVGEFCDKENQQLITKNIDENLKSLGNNYNLILEFDLQFY